MNNKSTANEISTVKAELMSTDRLDFLATRNDRAALSDRDHINNFQPVHTKPRTSCTHENRQCKAKYDPHGMTANETSAPQIIGLGPLSMRQKRRRSFRGLSVSSAASLGIAQSGCSLLTPKETTSAADVGRVDELDTKKDQSHTYDIDAKLEYVAPALDPAVNWEDPSIFDRSGFWGLFRYKNTAVEAEFIKFADETMPQFTVACGFISITIFICIPFFEKHLSLVEYALHGTGLVLQCVLLVALIFCHVGTPVTKVWLAGSVESRYQIGIFGEPIAFLKDMRDTLRNKEKRSPPADEGLSKEPSAGGNRPSRIDSIKAAKIREWITFGIITNAVSVTAFPAYTYERRCSNFALQNDYSGLSPEIILRMCAHALPFWSPMASLLFVLSEKPRVILHALGVFVTILFQAFGGLQVVLTDQVPGPSQQLLVPVAIHIASFAIFFLHIPLELGRREEFKQYAKAAYQYSKLDGQRKTLQEYLTNLIPCVLAKKLIATVQTTYVASTSSACPQHAAITHESSNSTVVMVDILNSDTIFPPSRYQFGVNPVSVEKLEIQAMTVLIELEKMLTRLSVASQMNRIALFGDMFCAAANIITETADHALRGVQFALRAVDGVRHKCESCSLFGASRPCIRAGVHCGFLMGHAMGSKGPIHYGIHGRALVGATQCARMATAYEVVVSREAAMQVQESQRKQPILEITFEPLQQEGGTDTLQDTWQPLQGGDSFDSRRDCSTSLSVQERNVTSNLAALRARYATTVPLEFKDRAGEPSQLNEQADDGTHHSPSCCEHGNEVSEDPWTEAAEGGPVAVEGAGVKEDEEASIVPPFTAVTESRHHSSLRSLSTDGSFHNKGGPRSGNMMRTASRFSATLLPYSENDPRTSLIKLPSSPMAQLTRRSSNCSFGKSFTPEEREQTNSHPNSDQDLPSEDGSSGIDQFPTTCKNSDNRLCDHPALHQQRMALRKVSPPMSLPEGSFQHESPVSKAPSPSSWPTDPPSATVDSFDGTGILSILQEDYQSQVNLEELFASLRVGHWLFFLQHFVESETEEKFQIVKMEVLGGIAFIQPVSIVVLSGLCWLLFVVSDTKNNWMSQEALNDQSRKHYIRLSDSNEDISQYICFSQLTIFGIVLLFITYKNVYVYKWRNRTTKRLNNALVVWCVLHFIYGIGPIGRDLMGFFVWHVLSSLLITTQFMPWSGLSASICDVLLILIAMVWTYVIGSYFPWWFPGTLFITLPVKTTLNELRERSERTSYMNKRLSSSVSVLVLREEAIQRRILGAMIPVPLQERFFNRNSDGNLNLLSPKMGAPLKLRSLLYPGSQVEPHGANYCYHDNALVVQVVFDFLFAGCEMSHSTAAVTNDPRHVPIDSSPESTSATGGCDCPLVTLDSLISTVQACVEKATLIHFYLTGEVTAQPENDEDDLEAVALSEQQLIRSPLSIVRVFGDSVMLCGPLDATSSRDASALNPATTNPLAPGGGQRRRETLQTDRSGAASIPGSFTAISFLYLLRQSVAKAAPKVSITAAAAHGSLFSTMTTGMYPTCEVFGGPILTAQALVGAAPTGNIVVTPPVAAASRVVLEEIKQYILPSLFPKPVLGNDAALGGSGLENPTSLPSSELRNIERDDLNVPLDHSIFDVNHLDCGDRQAWFSSSVSIVSAPSSHTSLPRMVPVASPQGSSYGAPIRQGASSWPQMGTADLITTRVAIVDPMHDANLSTTSPTTQPVPAALRVLTSFGIAINRQPAPGTTAESLTNFSPLHSPLDNQPKRQKETFERVACKIALSAVFSLEQRWKLKAQNYVTVEEEASVISKYSGSQGISLSNATTTPTTTSIGHGSSSVPALPQCIFPVPSNHFLNNSESDEDNGNDNPLGKSALVTQLSIGNSQSSHTETSSSHSANNTTPQRHSRTPKKGGKTIVRVKLLEFVEQ